jgi:hypothetical protein
MKSTRSPSKDSTERLGRWENASRAMILRSSTLKVERFDGLCRTATISSSKRAAARSAM